ncbi:MFS transporter [Zavarzinella formosa]|uniref:MFS transporter n=1 Tax=Zavarzinella formosa TaxID=360055 RepID=UPI0003041607|nr:MFS transporter [Zavarzinella formosa]
MSQTSSEPGKNEKILFWASFMTLIAAGIGFSVRGAILKDWGQQFSFTQSELGTITGGGLLAFGVTIIFFSFFADLFGYGKLMLVAFLLHASSAIVTFAATPVYAAYGKEGAYTCLSIGMWLFAFGNGTCEAVINPLTATLFPKNKTHWLNILHAGWPLGLVLGAGIVLGFGQVGQPIRWEFKLGVFLIPVLAYGILMFNKPFPRSEAHASGISMGTSILTLLSPVLLFLFVIHAMVGYVELGTDSWIVNITERVLGDANKALMAFIWTNIMMFTLRFFAGPIVHQISPLGLLFFSATLGTAGLYMLGLDFSSSTWPWIAAVTVYGIGKTFYWPTMLGVISERFPKGGALALGISGGIGMISAGMLGGPGIGYKQDYFSVQKIEETSPATYERYEARNDKGEPAKTGFPIVSQFAPDKAPLVAGIDNGKYKVLEDYQGVKKDPTKKIGIDEELDIIAAAKAKDPNAKGEDKLEANLNAQKKWWMEQGLPNEANDLPKLEEAKTYGAKHALLVTAAIPATMAICYLLLIIFFKLTGGYKQETI